MDFNLAALAPLTRQLMAMKPRQPAQGQGILSNPNAPQQMTANRRDVAAEGLLEMPSTKRPSLIDAFRNPNDVSNRGLVNLGLGLMTGQGWQDSLARGIAGYQEGVDQGQQIELEQWAKENQLRQQRIENANASTRLGLDQNADARAAELQPYKIAAEKAGIIEQTPDGGFVNKLDGTYYPPDPRIQAAVLQQLEAEGAIKVRIAGASAAAAAANNPTNYQSANVQLEDGSIVGGRFNPDRGQLEVRDANGSWVSAPVGSREVTPGAGGTVTANQFNKLESEVVSQEIGLNQLVNYAKTSGSLDQGIDRWVNTITANAKTLLGDPLTAQEFNQQLASGQLQGLMGALRLEVVGPGVLTEQDAQRIISYLGGDPASALQNPEVVKAAISRVVQDKMVSYGNVVGQYNRAAPSFGAVERKVIDFQSRLPKATVPEGTVVPGTVDGSTTGGVKWKFVPNN
jgi:hypothetical protein